MTGNSHFLVPQRLLDQQSSELSPSINANLLLNHCLGNISFALNLLEEFALHGKTQSDAVAEFVAKEEFQLAAEAAHTLKGTAALIGADELHRLALECESLGKFADTCRLAKAASLIDHEMDRCLSDILVLKDKLLKQLS